MLAATRGVPLGVQDRQLRLLDRFWQRMEIHWKALISITWPRMSFNKIMANQSSRHTNSLERCTSTNDKGDWGDSRVLF
jgi:hypothetical protein